MSSAVFPTITPLPDSVATSFGLGLDTLTEIALLLWGDGFCFGFSPVAETFCATVVTPDGEQALVALERRDLTGLVERNIEMGEFLWDLRDEMSCQEFEDDADDIWATSSVLRVRTAEIVIGAGLMPPAGVAEAMSAIMARELDSLMFSALCSDRIAAALPPSMVEQWKSDNVRGRSINRLSRDPLEQWVWLSNGSLSDAAKEEKGENPLH